MYSCCVVDISDRRLTERHYSAIPVSLNGCGLHLWRGILIRINTTGEHQGDGTDQGKANQHDEGCSIRSSGSLNQKSDQHGGQKTCKLSTCVNESIGGSDHGFGHRFERLRNDQCGDESSHNCDDGHVRNEGCNRTGMAHEIKEHCNQYTEYGSNDAIFACRNSVKHVSTEEHGENADQCRNGGEYAHLRHIQASDIDHIRWHPGLKSPVHRIDTEIADEQIPDHGRF